MTSLAFSMDPGLRRDDTEGVIGLVRNAITPKNKDPRSRRGLIVIKPKAKTSPNYPYRS
jgi:hypothetical protein